MSKLKKPASETKEAKTQEKAPKKGNGALDQVKQEMKNGGITSKKAIEILHPDTNFEDKDDVQAKGRAVRRQLRSIVEKEKGEIKKTEGKTKTYHLPA